MAMIQKKNYILRHIFLIIFLIIVLFPLVWVVTTSIRRDNAAFSPKLFSSRVTLNYYRDLLFPRATIPELIKDINGTLHFIGDNSSLSLEEAHKKLTKELNDFNLYITQTEDYLEDIENRFENLKKSLDDNNIILDINKARELEYNNLVDLEKSFLDNEYNIKNNINDLKTQLNEYVSLRNEIKSLLDNIRNDDNIEYYNSTLETIYSLNPNYTLWNIKVYKKWLKIESNENLSKLGPLVKELSNSWKTILTTAKDIDDYFAKLEKETLGQDLVLMTNYEKDIEDIKKEISLLKNDLSNIEREILKYNSDLTALLELYIPNSSKIESAVNIFKYNIGNKVESSEIMNLSDKINEFYTLFSSINENIQNLSDFDVYKGYIEKYYNSFSWLKDNLEFINPDLEKVKPAYNTLVSVINEYNDTLETLNNITYNLSTKLNNFDKYQNSLNELNSKLSELNTKYDEIYTKNKPILDKFSKLKQYGEFSILKTIANIEINSFYDSEYLADLLSSKLVDFYKPSKKDLNIFTLRKDILEASEKFNSSKESFENIIVQIKDKIDDLEKNAINYLKINYGGYTADILPIMEISSIYNSKFGPAKADISRSSRIVSDLADIINYKSLKSDLKTIDKNIYNLLDNWNPKQRKPFLRWLLNSIIVAGMTSILTVMITAVAAYPFSRMRFVGRKEGLLYLMLIQMFPAIMYMIALYGMLKFMGDYFGVIGLDTLSGLIFVYLGGVSFNMWLIKGYYDTIPDSLEESAMIDGATRFQTFWRIVLPLASPILAVVTILSFMGTFNEFVLARIVLSSETNYTYAVGLQTFTSGPFETEWGLFTAAALLGAVPMVLLFLSMQKYLVGGLTQGSVKG
ncbi:sugar ABC transporter permease [Marinitoga litoralis]|uniref:sugar ABC transporter permease n=1 Tax=Marinitoga litoralis TaxID=570855 RepID=UPI00196202B1|nr:sugar ABC transporter permease [Marinitoga litoralis]MBM7560440.1 maltose/maltodextrin transport system permease protein [Marinitoga litoralis]